jgi:hypothetical protein
MAEMLTRSPSARKMCTTTELSQHVATRVTEPAVPGRGRGSGGKSSRGGRWYSGSRNAKVVKGSRAVTAEERTLRSTILHNKARGVKLNRTRIASCKLTDGKKIMNHQRSNENIGKTKGTRSRTHGGDGKARSITNHDRRRVRRMCGANRRSRVVWKEARESAIHSVRAGGVTPMVMNACTGVAEVHPPGYVRGWLG